jgi:hypothetical protein
MEFVMRPEQKMGHNNMKNIITIPHTQSIHHINGMFKRRNA